MKIQHRLFQLFAVLWMLLLCPCAAMMSRREAMKQLGMTDPKFTEKDLKSAYRKRSLKTHPDKGGSTEDFVRVAEAYEFLNGGDTSKFSGFDGTSGGGRNNEEAMNKAEEMFFDMFEEFMDGQAADMLIDMFFGDLSEMSFIQRQFMNMVKYMAKGLINTVAEDLMSDSTQININGQMMTGADLKKLRDKMRERRQGVKGKSDL
jgi:DnaJ-class molecular chaperone